MKKLLIFLMSVSLIASLALFTACENFVKPKDSSETNSDITSDTGDTGSTADPIIVDPDKTAYEAPVITASEDGIIASHETSTIAMKIDDGEWEECSEVAFSEDDGEHIVKAKAIADDEYNESEAVSFAYTTVSTDLNVVKTANGISVQYTGTTLMMKVGEEYEECEETEFADPEPGVYAFLAMGGWDGENAVYYSGEVEQEIEVRKPADGILMIEDATGATASILQEDWEIKKYDGSNWVDTSASISVGKSYTGEDSMVFDCWINYTKFRYSKTYDASDIYNVIAFDVKGDGIATLELSIKDSASGIYASAKLGTLPSAWYHYEISIADAKWGLAYGGTSYPLAQAVAAYGSYIGVNDVNEILPFCDTVGFILYGETTNGANSHIYIDNVSLKYEAEPTTKYVQPLFALGTYYVPTSTVEGLPVLTLRMTDNGNSAQISSVGLENNVTFDMSVTIEGSNVTLKQKGVQEPLVVYGTFEENGRVVDITEATGNNAQFVDTSISYAVAADFTIDFENGTTGSQYVDSNWKQEQYVSEWKTISGQMNCREKDGSKVVNMAIGNGTTGKFTYDKGEPIGLANYFSVELGNYFSSSAEVKLQIYLLSTTGTKTYILGGDGIWDYFHVTTGMEKIERYLDVPVNVQSIVFVIENKAGINQYLYTDNFVVAYTFDKPAEPGPEGPELVETVVHAINFEDGAGSGNYVNSSWTQYMWDGSAYVATSGKMNSRNNGTKIVNMYGGYTTYKFIYNEGGSSLGKANKLTARVGNYFVNSAAIKIRLVVTDMNGTDHYLAGASGSFYDFPFTGSNTMISVSYEFAEMEVKSITVFVRYEGADNYLYVDDITLIYVSEAGEPAQPVEPEGPAYANLAIDFGTYTSNADYSGSEWTYDYYNNGWTDLTSTQMRYRQGDGASNNAVMNMAVDTMTRRYFYNKNGENSLGIANYYSIRLGNYFGSTAIDYKLAYVDANGGVHYLEGDANNWATIAKQGTNDSTATSQERVYLRRYRSTVLLSGRKGFERQQLSLYGRRNAPLRERIFHPGSGRFPAIRRGSRGYVLRSRGGDRRKRRKALR